MDATITTTMNIGGKSMSGVTTKTSNQSGATGPTDLPAGNGGGTLTTRTSDSNGVVTASGHDIVSAEIVDVFWTGGVRYGMTATVAGDAVTVDGGAGTVIPAKDTAEVITATVVIDLNVDGGDLVVFGMTASKRAHVEFLTEADATIYGQELADVGEWSWATGTGATNPLAGQSVGKLRVACGDATDVATFDSAYLYDDVV